MFTHTNLTVTDCIFVNNQANSGSAIFNKGGFLTVTDSVFEGNTAQTDLVHYSGGTINNYGGTYNIKGNVFIENTGSALHVDNYIPQGGIPTGLTLFTFNYIIGNTYGIYLEPFLGQAPIIGNFRINATNNWWGINSNPKNNPTDIAGDVNNVLADTWLVFTLQIPVNSMPKGESVQIIADITQNNLGQDVSSIGHIQDGIPVDFTSVNGDVGTLTETPTTVNGLVYALFTADQGTGIANISAYIYGSLMHATAHVMITAVTPPVTPPVNQCIPWKIHLGSFLTTTLQPLDR